MQINRALLTLTMGIAMAGAGKKSEPAEETELMNDDKNPAPAPPATMDSALALLRDLRTMTDCLVARTEAAESALAASEARVKSLESDNERLRLAFDDEDEKASVHWYMEWVEYKRRAEAAESALVEARKDSTRLDYIERTFSGMTNRERYLPVKMIWGAGANGRSLREACDKYMQRDALLAQDKRKP